LFPLALLFKCRDALSHPELVHKRLEKIELTGQSYSLLCILSPEPAGTFILDMGMIVMMFGWNESVAFRASVANAGAMALAARSHGTLTAPNRTSRWILF